MYNLKSRDYRPYACEPEENPNPNTASIRHASSCLAWETHVGLRYVLLSFGFVREREIVPPVKGKYRERSCAGRDRSHHVCIYAQARTRKLFGANNVRIQKTSANAHPMKVEI